MRTLWLRMKMTFAVIALFALIYALVTAIAYSMGVGTPILYAVMAFGFVGFQFMIGPKIVEWSMRVHYVSREEAPQLHDMIEDLAMRANIPKPKVGISEIGIPNAFAFGRSKRDARVCVTRGILNLLDENELRAVLGHELSHIKHRDVVVITALSAIPMICYLVFYSMFWSSMFRRDRNSGATIAIALVAFAVYLVSNLIVLYVSRIREYYADQGSSEITGEPHLLASALYKMVMGSVRVDRKELKRVEGMKAFFATDPSRARKEAMDLSSADLNRDGRLDQYEVDAIAMDADKYIGRIDRIMEVFSTHPNPVKRIARLSRI